MFALANMCVQIPGTWSRSGHLHEPFQLHSPKQWSYQVAGISVLLTLPSSASLPVFVQDQPMGSWRLKRQVDFGEELVYKFTPKFVLKAGQSVTVRSIMLDTRPSSVRPSVHIVAFTTTTTTVCACLCVRVAPPLLSKGGGAWMCISLLDCRPRRPLMSSDPVLDPDQARLSMQVWSADAGVVHSPPGHLLWKTQASWGTGNDMETVLINGDGEVTSLNVVSCV